MMRTNASRAHGGRRSCSANGLGRARHGSDPAKRGPPPIRVVLARSPKARAGAHARPLPCGADPKPSRPGRLPVRLLLQPGRSMHQDSVPEQGSGVPYRAKSGRQPERTQRFDCAPTGARLSLIARGPPTGASIYRSRPRRIRDRTRRCGVVTTPRPVAAPCRRARLHRVANPVTRRLCTTPHGGPRVVRPRPAGRRRS